MGKKGPSRKTKRTEKKQQVGPELGIRKAGGGIFKKQPSSDGSSMDIEGLDGSSAMDSITDLGRDGALSLGQLKKRQVAEKKQLKHELLHMRSHKCGASTRATRAEWLAAGLLGCWAAGLLGCWAAAGLLGCWVAGLLLAAGSQLSWRWRRQWWWWQWWWRG